MDHAQAPELRREYRRELQDPGRVPERPEDRRVHGHDRIHSYDDSTPVPRTQETAALHAGRMGHVFEHV